MRNIQPFGCDVTESPADEIKHFLYLLQRTEKTYSVKGISNYFGIDVTGVVNGCVSKDCANRLFKQIIPVKQGIEILEQAFTNEPTISEVEYYRHTINLTNGKIAMIHIPKCADNVDILLFISKLENILTNTFKTKS